MRVVALAIILALTLGCATRISVRDPQVVVVWGDAYTQDCPTEMVWDDDEGKCVEGMVEVRGGHMGETFVSFISAIFEGVGKVLIFLLPKPPA
jgi:uncharacterized protein YceK